MLTAEQTKVKVVLPTSKGELVAGKVLKLDNIHDHVEPLFINLWDEEEFRQYFNGVYDSDCAEGSIKADEHMAAMRVRESAIEAGDHFLAKKNIATIVKSLHVVMNRFGLNRSQRRQMVGDQRIPTMGSED